jgi:hypothetical protein
MCLWSSKHRFTTWQPLFSLEMHMHHFETTFFKKFMHLYEVQTTLSIILLANGLGPMALQSNHSGVRLPIIISSSNFYSNLSISIK